MGIFHGYVKLPEAISDGKSTSWRFANGRIRCIILKELTSRKRSSVFSRNRRDFWKVFHRGCWLTQRAKMKMFWNEEQNMCGPANLRIRSILYISMASLSNLYIQLYNDMMSMPRSNIATQKIWMVSEVSNPINHQPFAGPTGTPILTHSHMDSL